MRMVLIFFIILFLVTSCATPRPWTKGEKTAAYFFIAAHFADGYTTSQSLDNGNYEMNPILGKYPSDSELVVYFSVTGAIALVLSHYKPSLRKPLLYGYGSVNTAFAIHNHQLSSH